MPTAYVLKKLTKFPGIPKEKARGIPLHYFRIRMVSIQWPHSEMKAIK